MTVAGPSNIVLIRADELGFSDLAGCGSEIATRNLVRMAYARIRLTRMHKSARCASRAPLPIGVYTTHARRLPGDRERARGAPVARHDAGPE